MTGSMSITQTTRLHGVEKLQKATGAFFEVSEEAVRGLTNSSSAGCSKFPNNDHPSETTSTSTVTTSTDSITNSLATVSKGTKKQLQKQEREAALKLVLLQQLEKQIAYYFSPSNLETDTYLRTLQGLNDGCVPVRALANFGKVKGILWATPTLTRQYLEEEARMEIIVESIQQIETSVLQVEEIDTSTGKILLQGDERHAKNTIKGVRLKPGTDYSACTLDQQNKHSESIPETCSNTILLRDVHPDVTEDQVYHLLLNEVAMCPLVLSLRRDVANCWFIELDCGSRETMLNVVMQLRSLTLADEYIHARLKSSTLHQAPSLDPIAVVIAEQVARRRRKKRGLRKNKKKVVNENEGRHRENEKSAQSRKLSNTTERSQKTAEQRVNLPPPQTLEESEFPSLCEGTSDSLPSIEEQNDSLRRIHSKNDFGGYAAALLKPEKTAKPNARGGRENPEPIPLEGSKSSRSTETQRKSFADAARSLSRAA